MVFACSPISLQRHAWRLPVCQAIGRRRTHLRGIGELQCHGNIANDAAFTGKIRHRIERVVRVCTALSTGTAGDADRVRGKALCMRTMWRRTLRVNIRHLVACCELSGDSVPIRGQRQHSDTLVQPRRWHSADDTSRQWFDDAATDHDAQSVHHGRQWRH